MDNCVPGDTVTVSGIVKVSNVDEGKKKMVSSMILFLTAEVSKVEIVIG